MGWGSHMKGHRSMRGKKAFKNLISALLLQLVTAVCGLIIPKLIIQSYGSEVNGLVTSINQFLNYITFFEAGLTGVIMSLLYKPIAHHDTAQINQILADGKNYFHKIAAAYVGYVVVLALVYPRMIQTDYTHAYIGSLIVIMSSTLMCQYLFGIINNVFIQANQKAYITASIQTVVVLLNALVSFLVIQMNGSIHALKLFTVAVSVINPLGYYIYVKKNYQIDTSVKGDSRNIKQRRDGLWHHICYFIQTNIDVMILTFVDLKVVSIYAIYHMITNMIRQLIGALTHAFKSALGDLLARDEIAHLRDVFSLFEFILFNIATIVFTSLLYAILPFIRLYTKNIHDVNYILPAFAIIMVLSELSYTIRIPYHTLTIAAGHFRETKNSAIIEMVINFLLSLLLVRRYGIVGVAIGTFVSCMYRTLYYVNYLRKNIIHLSCRKFCGRIFTAFVCAVVCVTVFRLIPYRAENYFQWMLSGMLYVAIATIISLLGHTVFFRADMKNLLKKLGGVLNGR